MPEPLLSRDLRQLALSEVHEVAGVVIPAYFSPSVPESRVEVILRRLLVDAPVYCRSERLVVVVDRATHTERVLDRIGDLNLVRLQKNRGKAGAVAAGLGALLASTDARFLVTRDCDGDHLQEDMPRLVSLAVGMEEVTGNPLVCAMGARASLEKPMGWVREEWERLSNRVLVDLVGLVLARSEQVLDRRFWNGVEPDLQSGYRVYSRAAAEMTVRCLHEIPDEPLILTFACEFVPFARLGLAGAVFGQAHRLTLVEQPVSAYNEVDYATVYARLLSSLGEQLGIARPLLLRIFDNYLAGTSLYFSNHRPAVDRARELILGEVPPRVALAGFV